MVKVKEIDIDSFSKPKVQTKFPYIELEEFNDTLPTIVTLLEPGEVQVQATYKGVTKCICSMSKSAYNIDKLLRTKQKVKMYLSESQSVEIKSVVDYLEVI